MIGCPDIAKITTSRSLQYGGPVGSSGSEPVYNPGFIIPPPQVRPGHVPVRLRAGTIIPGIHRGYQIPFECSQCGECCSHLGLVHTIREDYGNYRYLVNNEYTGEKNTVVVDPDKIVLFRDRSIFAERPEACPFFRFDREAAKGYCTVHLTRPEICRDYGCWRILILDAEGKRAGRIMCQRFLASEDERLTRIFEEEINNIAEPDDAAWDDRLTRVLVAAGYTVQT